MEIGSDSSQKTLTANSEDVKDGGTGVSILAGDCRGAMNCAQEASTEAAHEPGLARARQEGQPCHPERSEGSRCPLSQTLRSAQGDMLGPLG